MINKIKELIVKIKEGGVELQDIDEQANLIDDIGLDSLQLINFLLSVEDEFNIEIDFDNLDFKHLQTITAFCEFINQSKPV